MNEAITGGCLCGACRYWTDAEPLNVRACHCRRCQKATGAPFYARVQVQLAGLEMAGPIGRFDAGTGVQRGFCTACGTSLFSERPSEGLIGLTMGSLDDPDRFRPAAHIFVAEKQAWLSLGDGLPQHPAFPPA